MKVISCEGKDITTMFLAFMEKMKTTLEFYEDKKYMEWERWSHQFVDNDNGQEARNTLDSYRDFMNKLEGDKS